MQPHPLAAFPAVADELDPHLGTDEVDRPETRDEGIRGLAHPERDLFGELERRFEGDLTRELRRRHAGLDVPRVAAGGESPESDSSLTQPLAHTLFGHRGERAQGLDAEAGEQVDDPRPRICIGERGDRQRGKKRGCRSLRHDADGISCCRRTACRVLGGERTVGNPDAYIGEAELPHPFEEHSRRSRLTTVVASGAAGADRAQSRADDLHPRGPFLELSDNGRERAMIACRVGRHDRKGRAARLRITPT